MVKCTKKMYEDIIFCANVKLTKWLILLHEEEGETGL
jgi:hypothetical protein